MQRELCNLGNGKEMRHYVKYLPFHKLYNASRDRREIIAASEYGFQVIVFSADKPNSINNIDGVDVAIFDGEIDVTYSIPKIKRIPLIIKNFATIVAKTRRINAEVFSCHDIMALLFCWISNFGRLKKIKLIYDSHELEIGRNTNGRRKKVEAVIIERIERYLMKRSAFTIIPCESAAEMLQNRYRLKNKPVVVRSTPPLWNLDYDRTRTTRCELLKNIDNSENDFIIMYHGIVGKGRGIEYVLDAMRFLTGVVFVVLGNGDDYYLQELKQLTRTYEIGNKVLFHKAVSIEELRHFVSAADCGMVNIQNVSMSYYFASPNKLFENIQAEVPVIASDFPELEKIVNKYNIGVLCKPDDPELIANAIKPMMEDKEKYKLFKDNLKNARKEL